MASPGQHSRGVGSPPLARTHPIGALLRHARLWTIGQARRPGCLARRAERTAHGTAQPLGFDSPLVVAHDFGGLAALRGHFVNGLDYHELFLIDPVALLPSASPFFMHARANFDTFADNPGFAHDALFKAFVSFGSLHGLSPETVEMYAELWRGEVGQPAFYRQILHSGDEYIREVQDLYRPTDFPVHLIWGEHDDNIPVTQGRRLADVLSAESLTVVPSVNQQAFTSSNLIGATTLEQLRENIASADVQLSDELVAKINAIHHHTPNPAP